MRFSIPVVLLGLALPLCWPAVVHAGMPTISLTMFARLWLHARDHDGRFPSDRSTSDIPRETWQLPDPSGMGYVYVGGLRVDDDRPLAYEPDLFGSQRLVLFANGEIRRLEWEQLALALT